MDGFGKRLRAWRESAMMPQAKFAVEIASSQSAINRFDNNQSEPNCTHLMCSPAVKSAYKPRY